MKKYLIVCLFALASYARADGLIGGTAPGVGSEPYLGYADAPSAAQAVTASSATQCRDVYNPVPTALTGIRVNVGVQSGHMMVALRNSTGFTLAQSTEPLTPAPGAATITFASIVSVSPGWYKLCIGADNTTATFGKSSGSGIIGCNNFTSDIPITSQITLPGTSTANCFAMVGVVNGGQTQ